MSFRTQLIFLEEYNIHEQINKDVFFTNLKIVEKRTGKFHILKVFEKEIPQLRNFLQKISCFIKISHPSIYRIEKMSAMNSKLPILSPTPKNHLEKPLDLSGLLLITPYYKNGTLLSATKEYLETNGQNNTKMNPTIRSKIIFGIATAMKTIHECGFINGYLNLNSIYLNDDFEPKIVISDYKTSLSDLNFCNLNEDSIFFAPEIFTDDEFDPRNVDIYSFAIVLYKMFTNEFSMPKKCRSVQKILYNLSIGLRPLKPKNIPDCYWELIYSCWNAEPIERPNFDEIIQILHDDKFAIEEFGMKTDIEQLHEYQKRITQKIDF